MAKWTRKVLGSVVKSKDPTKSNYIKMSLKHIGGSITLTDGQYINVESKKFQLDQLALGIKEGRLTEELSMKLRERIEKMPEFVLGDLVLLEKGE